jgi:hypothetical protein
MPVKKQRGPATVQPPLASFTVSNLSSCILHDQFVLPQPLPDAGFSTSSVLPAPVSAPQPLPDAGFSTSSG